MKIDFIITKYQTQSEKMMRLLNDVFGIHYNQIDKNHDMKIRCGTEKFSLFLIERNRRGISNDFKSMKPAIVNESKFSVNKFDLTLENDDEHKNTH